MYKYPLRFESKNSGQVVEFTSLREGTTIVSGRRHNPVGCQAHFVEHTDTSVWKPAAMPVKFRLHLAVNNYKEI